MPISDRCNRCRQHGQLKQHAVIPRQIEHLDDRQRWRIERRPGDVYHCGACRGVILAPGEGESFLHIGSLTPNHTWIPGSEV
jgi:hypothetical protein